MTDHTIAVPVATATVDVLRAGIHTLTDATSDVTKLQGAFNSLVDGNGNGGKQPPPPWLTSEPEQRQPRKSKGYTKNPLRLAITEFLQQAQGGEASEDEVVAGVRKHCVRDEDKAKRQVHDILVKNSYHYRRLPNENWALRR